MTPGGGRALCRLLERSAARCPQATAVEDPERGEALTYRELAGEAKRVREALVCRGITAGDRVAIHATKSVAAVASIFGALDAGAVYVPLDPSSPPERNRTVLEDSGARAVIGEQSHHTLPSGEGVTSRPAVLDPAYILYTSGSTGRPKGVLHTHASALSFLDWAADAFAPTGDDRFSSQAPFHFDLSILDLFLPIALGGTVVLIGEELGKEPRRLASWIAEQRITNWYSTPSVLRLLVQYGKMERHDYPALRRVLFAGEVFPVRPLQVLRRHWPGARYFNLYGPTETNVCTWYELPADSWEDRAEPFPIGFACSGCRTRVVDAAGSEVERGRRGELYVAGGSVMAEYWNRPRRTAAAFFVDGGGRRWYKTGDLVWEDAAGNYHFAGRRDRMVKRFGNRVELGEIEAALHRHPAVAEAAVAVIADGVSGIALRAFLHCEVPPPSLIAIKQFCAGLLPAYMVPDSFILGPPLPKTSTGKIDYRELARRLDPAWR